MHLVLIAHKVRAYVLRLAVAVHVPFAARVDAVEMGDGFVDRDEGIEPIARVCWSRRKRSTRGTRLNSVSGILQWRR